MMMIPRRKNEFDLLGEMFKDPLYNMLENDKYYFLFRRIDFIEVNSL